METKYLFQLYALLLDFPNVAFFNIETDLLTDEEETETLNESLKALCGSITYCGSGKWLLRNHCIETDESMDVMHIDLEEDLETFMPIFEPKFEKVFDSVIDIISNETDYSYENVIRYLEQSLYGLSISDIDDLIAAISDAPRVFSSIMHIAMVNGFDFEVLKDIIKAGATVRPNDHIAMVVEDSDDGNDDEAEDPILDFYKVGKVRASEVLEPRDLFLQQLREDKFGAIGFDYKSDCRHFGDVRVTGSAVAPSSLTTQQNDAGVYLNLETSTEDFSLKVYPGNGDIAGVTISYRKNENGEWNFDNTVRFTKLSVCPRYVIGQLSLKLFRDENVAVSFAQALFNILQRCELLFNDDPIETEGIPTTVEGWLEAPNLES